MLTESIVMAPEYNSTSRNSPASNELLPAPVLPTTPTFSAGLVSKEIPFKDGAR